MIIVGGGMSGLLAGWFLSRRGIPSEIWEASATPGGWVATCPWPGPGGGPGMLERGPQDLLAARGGTLSRLLEDLGLQVRPMGPRGPRWMGRGDHRQPCPTTLPGLLLAPGMTLGEKVRILGEPWAAGASAEESLQDFFRRRLGKGFAREVLPALAAGILAAPPDRIALEAIPRLQRLEALGGLLRGGIRSGPEHRIHLQGGTGQLAQGLAARLTIRTGLAASGLEALPEGGWRVMGGAFVREARQVVVAADSRKAARLLEGPAPEAASRIHRIPRLDLCIWHSRHPVVPSWSRGMALRLDPEGSGGLLGALSLPEGDERGAPGLTQARTYLGGAWPLAPGLEDWPGVEARLRTLLPELPPAVQVRLERAAGAYPLLEPGHARRMEVLSGLLPRGLHWIGDARFGPGVGTLAGAIEAWSKAFPGP